MKIRIEAEKQLFTFVDVEVPDEIADNDSAKQREAVDEWINENMDFFNWRDLDTQDSVFDWQIWRRL